MKSLSCLTCANHEVVIRKGSRATQVNSIRHWDEIWALGNPGTPQPRTSAAPGFFHFQLLGVHSSLQVVFVPLWSEQITQSPGGKQVLQSCSTTSFDIPLRLVLIRNNTKVKGEQAYIRQCRMWCGFVKSCVCGGGGNGMRTP